MSAEVLQAAAELVRSGRRGAIITIVSTTGSTPRKAGAKMLVAEDGTLTGTVGGGCVEADLVAAAQEVLRTGRVRTEEVDLTVKSAGETDMLCGGRLLALIEPVQADERLIVFGAGHISRALHDAVQGLGFAFVVTDDREEFANRERFPRAAEIVVAPFAEQMARLTVDRRSSIVIATRGHSHDELCMAAALRSPARHIALIGSKTKVGVFRARLRGEGFTDADLARVKCPAGLDIGAETPEEIAVSLAAELVAVRRGRGPAGG